MSHRPKIVILDGKTLNPGDNPWTPVEAMGEITVHDRTPDDQIVSRCQGASIVLTNKVPFSEKTLAQLPELKLIAVTATGYNVIDVAAANRQGVMVSNVPEYSTDSVAQHVFAMLLSFLHQPVEHNAAIAEGHWQEIGDFSFTLSPIQELAGMTMGVVGLGRIGRATAKVANAFGMRVVASSRTEKNPLPYEDFEWLPVEKLFAVSDVISLHLPQTTTNAQFVNAALLSQMKSSGILINAARGGLINEADLAQALNGGRIAGALLDVVSSEPIGENNPLLQAKNCIITPHIAWATLAARKRLLDATAENIRAFLSGNPVNIVS
jgi:glycerate dehydrogenase